MNKLFTFLFALSCVSGVLAAKYDCFVDGIYYKLDKENLTATVTNEKGGYVGYAKQAAKSYSGSVAIPSSITYKKQNYSVKTIESFAFDYCTGLTSVTIPNSVTTIGDYAFSWCSGLTSITIPNSVTTIGKEAFYMCVGLTSVTIPNSVTTIGESAFSWCFGLTSVTIPNSVTTIGESAFSDCSGLTSVTIPNSVKTIGTSAFFDVANIVYNGTATGSPWGAKCVNGFVDGYLVYSDNSKTTLLVCSHVATGDIVIPNSVTTIGKEAFYDCDGLTSVTIPNSVTTIGERAFMSCSGLTSITIPRSVTTIGYWAFCGCSGLTSVTILNPNIKISKDAFNGCTITDFYCGKTVDLSTVRVTIQNIHRLNDEE